MKHLAMVLLLAMSIGTAQASLINISGTITDLDLGSFDTLLFSATPGNSSDLLETTTLATHLGIDADSLTIQREEYADPAAAGWYMSTENAQEVLTYDFGTGFDADYFVLKIGNSNTGDTHYYFDNAYTLQYAYIGITDMFSESAFPSDRFNVGRISHVSDFDSVSAVPLPATIWLFGAGLMGFVAMGRRRSI